jgi:hypothetical protein
MRQYLGAHLLLHGRGRAFGRWTRDERARGRGLRALARELAVSAAPAPVAARIRSLRRRRSAFLPAWVDAANLGRSVRERDRRRPARQRWLEAQLDPLRGAATTVEADEICAAYCGVRVRRPLVDVDLWEFFLSLPAETKFPNAVSKHLVREAARGRLPEEVVDRRDKTAFDDHALAIADYAGLRRLLGDRDFRVAGIDYTRLRERLDRRTMNVFELMWAYDLARIHAFVSVWR